MLLLRDAMARTSKSTSNIDIDIDIDMDRGWRAEG